MNAAHKILTVSYGTFSCTLEGFDDPFNTMKAIAEYFRDLAAEDRYFGAEPPQPDAAMLHKIAEREIQRRVEAKINENGVVLRARDIEAAPQSAAPQQPETPVHAVAAPLSAPEQEAAPVAAAPVAAPIQTRAQPVVAPNVTLSPAPAPKILAEEAAAAAMASAAQRLHRLRAAQAAPIAAAVAAPVLAPVAAPIVASQAEPALKAEPKAEIAAEEALLAALAPEPVTPESVTPEPVAEAAPVALPEPEAFDTTDALLNSLRETLAGALETEVIAPAQDIAVDAQGTTETATDDTARMLSETLAGIEAQFADILPETDVLPDTDIEAETAFEADEAFPALAEAAEPAADLAQAPDAPQGETLPQADLADEGTEAPTADILAALSDVTLADVTLADVTLADETLADETGLETAPPKAEDSDEIAFDSADTQAAPVTELLLSDPAPVLLAPEADAASDIEAEPLALTEPQAATEAAEVMAEPAKAEALPEPALSEPALAEPYITEPDITEPLAEAVANAPAPLVAEKIQRARARVIKIRRLEAPSVAEADTAPAAEPAAEPVTAPVTAPDAVDDRATAAAIRASMVEAPAPHRLPAAETDEASVDRLLQKANTEFDEPQTKRRRSAIAHLKAAVLATVAERRARGAPKPDDTLRQDPYRKDLDQVMRPAPAAEKPAPLMLLPTLRIDRTKAETAPSPSPAPAPQPVKAEAPAPAIIPRRPVRVQRPAFRPEEDELAAEISAAEVSNVFHDAPKQSFQDFADGLGASSLQDLIEAAGAYLTVTKGDGGFTRPELFAQISALGSEPSREDGLRGFGRLLREGRLTKTDAGTYALTETSPMLAQAKRRAS